MRVRIVYSDGSSQIESVTIAGGSFYTERRTPPIVLTRADVTSIAVIIRHASTGRDSLVDDVSLLVTRADPTRSTGSEEVPLALPGSDAAPLPLPEADSN